MSSLSNSPSKMMAIRLEQAKSFSFETHFTVADDTPADLTGCTLSLVVRKPAYAGGTVVFTETAIIDEVTSGYARFDLQAADTDQIPGEYPYTITLKTAENYTVVVVKGYIEILENTEDTWVGTTYGGVLPPTSLTVKLMKDNTFHVSLGSVRSMVPTNDASIASLLASATSATRVALDSLYAPLAHTHAVGDITGVLPVSKGGTGVATHGAGMFLTGAGAAAVESTKAVPAGAVVGTTDAQTLTNKTIALGSNTVSGTLAQFNTAVTDENLVSRDGAETLTNKNLTSTTNTFPELGFRGYVVFSASGTFTKATYPWLRAIKAIIVGGGGGSGGCAATGAGQNASSGGGGGGGCGEKFIAASALAANETVTVGTGGAGGAAGANNGSAGGATSFGAHCSAGGGGGGTGGAATAGPAVVAGGTGGTLTGTHWGGGGGSGSGGPGWVGSGNTRVPTNYGGGNLRAAITPASSGAATAGKLYGGGASGGGLGVSASAIAGADGADGIVIIELYA